MSKILLTLTLFFCSAAASATERIISLKPNITEIIYALHAEEQLVGVTTYCNRPAAAKKLPRVADYLAPSLEKVTTLKPDLILTSEENGKAAPILRLQELGYKVYIYPFKNIHETLNSMQEIARDVQREEQGKKLVGNLQIELKKIQNLARAQKPSVLFVVSTEPLIAAGPGTLLDELLQIAGGKNVLEKSYSAYPRLNEENLLELQPEIIITLYMTQQSQHEPWNKFPQLQANLKNTIYHLNMDDFRASPNIAKAASNLQKLLYAPAHE